MKQETRGRKPKSGKIVKFRPSVKVWSILENLPNKTKFIEESIIHFHSFNIEKEFALKKIQEDFKNHKKENSVKI